MAYEPQTIKVISTTDATATTVATIPIAASMTTFITGFVVGRRTGGSAGAAEDGFCSEIAVAYKNVSGTPTLIGSSLPSLLRDQLTWAVSFLVSSTNVLIQVTGAVNNNVNWECFIKTYTVT